MNGLPSSRKAGLGAGNHQGRGATNSVNVCFWVQKKLFSGKSICAKMGPVVERDKREVSRHERGGRL
jgi:hypothetical protein